jgi:hypothetical protein
LQRSRYVKIYAHQIPKHQTLHPHYASAPC